MIRYDKKLQQQLVKTVRNFNAKVNRLERAGIASPAEKVSIKEIKQDFTDRRELISYMRELRKFSQRGIERTVYVDRYGTEFSKYEFKIGASRQRRAIRKGEELLAKARTIHRTEAGVKEPQTLMGTDYANNLEANLSKLKSKKFTQTLSKAQQAQLSKASKRIIGTAKYKFQLISNFEQELQVLASAAKIPSSVVDHIMTELKKLDGSSFERARQAEELILKIEEYYPQFKEAKTATEKQQIANSVKPLIMQLNDTIEIIVAEMLAQEDGEQ